MTRTTYEERVTYSHEIDKLHESALDSVVLRVPLKRPLTRHQLVVASLVAERYSAAEISAVTGISERTVHWHTRRAADRIPGDLPPIERVCAWYRGATIQVLTGRSVFDPPATVTDCLARGDDDKLVGDNHVPPQAHPE